LSLHDALPISPFISEGRTSIVQPGFFRRIARTVSANTAAPPSFKSSRATAVTTTCFKPIICTESATRSASSQSSSLGRPVLTAQKRHPRVHVSPKIMKVAVFRSLQHSWILGHFASSQTVCRFFPRMSYYKCTQDLFVFSLIISHAAFRIYCCYLVHIFAHHQIKSLFSQNKVLVTLTHLLSSYLLHGLYLILHSTVRGTG